MVHGGHLRVILVVIFGFRQWEFREGQNRLTLGLDGTETFDIIGLKDGISPQMDVSCNITRVDGSTKNILLLCRIDTVDEVEYYRHGGILQYVLRDLNF